MKIPIDSSILIKKFQEKSEPYITFFYEISVLNKYSYQPVVFLCINHEIEREYEKLFRGEQVTHSTIESYDKWYKEFYEYFWKRGGYLTDSDTNELSKYCKHPVEHALIAFADQNDKYLVAAREDKRIVPKRCFFVESDVVKYISKKNIEVLDVPEMLQIFKKQYSITPKMVSSIKELRQKISNCFNKQELRTLCADISLPDENLLVGDKDNSIINIINYCQRHGREGKLLNYLIKERPREKWELNN